MRVEKDFEDLLRLFNKYKVRYCIIGSYALAFYARPRYTKDLDILIEPQARNADKILRALAEFGFGSLNLTPNDFSQDGQIIQLGYEPVRIDIITSIKGLNFRDVWKNRVSGPFGAENVYFIGCNDFIKAKKISDRPQDRADLEILMKYQDRSD